MSQSIPLLNLREQYQAVSAELEAAVLAVLRSGSYILGQKGIQLENEIASFSGCKFGVGVANGTDALTLALWALDIGPGDEVITTSFTFAATAEAITLRGAIPVFVDIDEASFNIDPALVERAVTAKTRAIMPVHLYGQPADMDPIKAIADRHGLKIIEDNAQAIGATYKGRPTGALSDLACISFYPTKNLGAAGDAGMIVTNSEELNERLRCLRAHGSRQRYFHDELGVNSRLDELQAVVLLSKLPYLSEWNRKRQAVADLYEGALKPLNGIVTPTISLPGVKSARSLLTHVWHQYTIRVLSGTATDGAGRDELIKKLAERGIGSMCYYPVPLHLQKAFASLGYKKGDFPITERLSNEVLSLPMYPELTEDQIATVARAVNECLLPESAFVPQPVAQPIFSS